MKSRARSRVAECAVEGALRSKSTSFEEHSFGIRDFFCFERSALQVKRLSSAALKAAIQTTLTILTI